MTSEQNGNSVEVLQLEAQPVLSIRGIVMIERLGEAMGERIGALSEYLGQHGITPAGPFFVLYHTFGEVETDMETGIPVTQPVEVVAGGGQNNQGAGHPRHAACESRSWRRPRRRGRAAGWARRHHVTLWSPSEPGR